MELLRKFIKFYHSQPNKNPVSPLRHAFNPIERRNLYRRLIENMNGMPAFGISIKVMDDRGEYIVLGDLSKTKYDIDFYPNGEIYGR